MVQNGIENLDWDYLTIMNDEDVAYEQLPETVLVKLALGGELYMATSAISELSIRQSEKVVPVTWKILSKALGDPYLQAAALEALFEMDQTKAVVYMTEHVQDCEPYVLNTIMELLVRMENSSNFRIESVSMLVSMIVERLKILGDQAKLPDPEVRANFLELFCYSLV